MCRNPNIYLRMDWDLELNTTCRVSNPFIGTSPNIYLRKDPQECEISGFNVQHVMEKTEP